MKCVWKIDFGVGNRIHFFQSAVGKKAHKNDDHEREDDAADNVEFVAPADEFESIDARVCLSIIMQSFCLRMVCLVFKLATAVVCMVCVEFRVCRHL